MVTSASCECQTRKQVENSFVHSESTNVASRLRTKIENKKLGADRNEAVSTPAYLGPVTSTYTARNTERYPFSILPFGVTAMRAAVGRLQKPVKRMVWPGSGVLVLCAVDWNDPAEYETVSARPTRNVLS